jgi:hypothetical protein
MGEENLKDVLSLCEKSAEKGVKIVLKHQEVLNNTLKRAIGELKETISEFSKTEYNALNSRDSLEEQLIKIKSSFERLSVELDYDIKKNKRNLSEFSITLFGRTMAGKSTLMEILTHGNGKSIGEGAQRTTRDIRTYSWNGLKITDVPGIAAFEGKDDENLAFENAKTADLILFLITDDGPQVAEAECFSRIVKLGKPIIGILNVKANISNKDETEFKLGLRNINKKIGNKENLDAIKKQFLDYSKNYGQDWTNIPFVSLHLRGAYLSQNIENLENSRTLYEASKITLLKEKIIEQVKDKGQFYRIKTFVDLISNPMLDNIDILLKQSTENISNVRILLKKKKELEKWKEKFYIDGRREIEALVGRIKSDLNSEIASFAEDHFEDKNATKEWSKILKQKKIEIRCEDLFKELENRAKNKVNEIVREVLNELKYSSYILSEYKFNLDKIINWKSYWGWSTTLIGGGLGIGAIIAGAMGSVLATPLLVAGIVVGVVAFLGGFLFDDRNKKEHEARRKLENKLRKNINETCEKLEKELKENFEILINKGLLSLIEEFKNIIYPIFKLADIQKKLAWSLNENLTELNKQIVTEAIYLIGATGMEYHINSIARIPGINILFMLDEGKKVPESEIIKLNKLLSEKIDFNYYNINKKILISRILGNAVDINDIKIDEENELAYIKLGNITADIYYKVKLAQQLSKILIINNREEK